MSRTGWVLASLFILPLTACLTPSRDYHGYIADEAQPREIVPGEDTRSTVLAQLGSPSTQSLFDDNTWIYTSDIQESIAYLKPQVIHRSVVAIRFGEDDKVAEVVEYNVHDGEIVNYAAKETPTLGRELGFWEQLFGTVGNVRLPRTDEDITADPNQR